MMAKHMGKALGALKDKYNGDAYSKMMGKKTPMAAEGEEDNSKLSPPVHAMEQEHMGMEPDGDEAMEMHPGMPDNTSEPGMDHDPMTKSDPMEGVEPVPKMTPEELRAKLGRYTSSTKEPMKMGRPGASGMSQQVAPAVAIKVKMGKKGM